MYVWVLNSSFRSSSTTTAFGKHRAIRTDVMKRLGVGANPVGDVARVIRNLQESSESSDWRSPKRSRASVPYTGRSSGAEVDAIYTAVRTSRNMVVSSLSAVWTDARLQNCRSFFFLLEKIKIYAIVDAARVDSYVLVFKEAKSEVEYIILTDVRGSIWDIPRNATGNHEDGIVQNENKHMMLRIIEYFLSI